MFDEFGFPLKNSLKPHGLPIMGRAGMIPFDPDYYMARHHGWSSPHWSDILDKSSSSTSLPLVPIKPSDVAREIIDVEIIDEKKPLRIAEIEIEELDGDLMAGVKTKALKEVNFTSPIYRVPKSAKTYFDKEINDSTVDKDGNHRIEVETYLASDAIGRWEDGAWSEFHMQGLTLLESHVCKVVNGSEKYFKISQHFKLAVTGKDIVPYLQLVCNARRAKYLGNWYKDGDVITLFVKHHFMPRVPFPALLSVQPTADQTFIPMLPKQKLQIITDSSEASLEFTFDAKSSLLYTGREKIPLDKAKRIGSNVICDFFECIRNTENQELIFVNTKSNQYRTVLVPVIPKTRSEKRFPVIVDPVRSCVIHSHNIDGFILRSYKKMTLTIDKDCPLQSIYDMEKDDYNETKVKLTKDVPYFRLERVNNNKWIVKTD